MACDSPGHCFGQDCNLYSRAERLGESNTPFRMLNAFTHFCVHHNKGVSSWVLLTERFRYSRVSPNSNKTNIECDVMSASCRPLIHDKQTKSYGINFLKYHECHLSTDTLISQRLIKVNEKRSTVLITRRFWKSAKGKMEHHS